MGSLSEYKKVTGSFSLLSSETASIPNKIKLARYLWQREDKIPRKEQSIISWLTSSIVTLDNRSTTDEILLWSTLADLLKSDQLSYYFEMHPQDIVVRTPFIKKYIKTIETIRNNNDLMHALIEVGTCLIVMKKISSDVGVKLLSLVEVAVAWLGAINRVTSCNFDVKEEFVELVLDRLNSSLLQHNNPMKAFGLFVNKVFVPLMQCYLKLCDLPKLSNLVYLMEELLQSGLCLRKFRMIGGRGSRESDGTKVQNMKIHKDSEDDFWHRMDNLSAYYKEQPTWIVAMQKLFMASHHKSSAREKFMFFEKLVAYLFEQSTLTPESVFALAALLELNVKESPHQPSLDEDYAKHQNHCYSELLNSLLALPVSSKWLSCFISLCSINYELVENKLSSVLSIITSSDFDDRKDLSQFFTHIVVTFNNVRKPLVLIKAFIEALTQAPHEVSQVSTIVQIFSDSVTSHCIVLCPHGVVLDIWTEIQNVLKLPNKNDTAPKCGEEIIDRKRKLVMDSCAAGKKARRSVSDAEAYLSIMLCYVIEGCDVLNMINQVPIQRRLVELLHDQKQLIFQLFDTSIDPQDHIHIESLIRLITAHENLRHLIRRYDVTGADEGSPENFMENEYLEKLSTLCADNSSLSTKFLFRKWQCSRIQWLSWKLSKETKMELANKIGAEIKRLSSDFVKSIEEVNGGFSWDGMCQNIQDQGTLSVALLGLMRRNFHLFVVYCDEQDAMAKIFVTSLCENQGDSKNKTISNVVDDILVTSSFHESTSLHDAMMKQLVLFFRESFCELKQEKKIVKKLMNGDDLSSTKELWKELFSDETKQALQFDGLRKFVQLINRFQQFSKETTLSSSVLIFLIISKLSRYREDHTSHDDTSHDHTSHDYTSLFDQCIVALEKLQGNGNCSELLNFLPCEILLPFAKQHPRTHNAMRLKMERILSYMIADCCHDNDALVSLVTTLMKSSDVGVRSHGLLIATIALQSTSTRILRYFKVLTKNYDILLFLEEYDVESFTVTKEMFKRKKDGLICDDAMQRLCRFINSLIQVTSHLASQQRKLLFSHLLATFAIEVSGETSMSADMDITLSEKEASNISGKTVDKLKLMILRDEIRTFKGNQEAERNHTTIDVWVESLHRLIHLSASNNVNTALQMIINRILVIRLKQVPSLKYLSTFLARILNELLEERSEAVVTSLGSFVSLLASVYDVRAKQFLSASGPHNESDEKESDRNFYTTYVKFLRDVFDMLVNNCFGIGQSMSRDILQIIADILNLGPSIIHSRQLPVVFIALNRTEVLGGNDEKSQQRQLQLQLFSSIFRVINSIVVHHKLAVKNLVPLILSVCEKMFDFVIDIGRQLPINKQWIDHSVESARRIERIFKSIETNYSSYFKRSVAFTLATLIHGLSRHVLFCDVKTSLQCAMYHLVSLCDDYSVAMLRATLPPGVREVFRQFHVDYAKYFKYTGRV